MINLHYFLSTIREVLFDLLVRELEYLKPIVESSLRCFGLSEIIYNFLVRESLLNILVVEIDDSVSIWEGLTLYTVVKNDFLFAVSIHSLNFSITTNVLINNLSCCRSLCMVFGREFKSKIFLFFFTRLVLIVILFFVFIFLFLLHVVSLFNFKLFLFLFIILVMVDLNFRTINFISMFT